MTSKQDELNGAHGQVSAPVQPVQVTETKEPEIKTKQDIAFLAAVSGGWVVVGAASYGLVGALAHNLVNLMVSVANGTFGTSMAGTQIDSQSWIVGGAMLGVGLMLLPAVKSAKDMLPMFQSGGLGAVGELIKSEFLKTGKYLREDARRLPGEMVNVALFAVDTVKEKLKNRKDKGAEVQEASASTTKNKNPLK